MKRILLIILAAVTVITLCACKEPVDVNVSLPEESSADSSSVSVPDETSVHIDIPSVAEEIVDMFFDLQTKTNYYDVTKRVYTDSSKSDFTDFYGLANPDKSLCCVCKYQDFLNPVIIASQVIENRFITRSGENAVLVNERGEILNTTELTSVSFPSTVAETVTVTDASAILGIALLTTNKYRLISSSGLLFGDAEYDSVKLTNAMGYLCTADGKEIRVSLTGEQFDETGFRYEPVRELGNGYKIRRAVSWDGISYQVTVADAEGNDTVVLSDFETDAFELGFELGWIVYTNATVDEATGLEQKQDTIYSLTGETVSNAFTDVVLSEYNPTLAVGYFEHETVTMQIVGGVSVPTVTTDIYCRIIDSYTRPAYTECFKSCKFIDNDIIQVTKTDGMITENFLSQLTKNELSETYISILDNYALVGVSYITLDLTGDGEKELLISLPNRSDTYTVFMPDGSYALTVSGKVFYNAAGKITVSTAQTGENYISYTFDGTSFVFDGSSIGYTSLNSGKGYIYYDINDRGPIDCVSAFYDGVWNTAYRIGGTAMGQEIPLISYAITSADYQNKLSAMKAGTKQFDEILITYVHVDAPVEDTSTAE